MSGFCFRYLTPEIAHEKKGEFTKSQKVYPKEKKPILRRTMEAGINQRD